MIFGDESFAFARSWALWLFLALPILAWLRGRRGAAPALLFSSLAPFKKIGRDRRARFGGWSASALLFATLAAFIFALARPQLGRNFRQIEASGIDIMIALDVSGSMIAEDFTIAGERASRLEVVKQVTQKFIEGRPNDRIGIVCFAGRPYLVSPLTLDHEWLLRNLERVRLGLVEDGTAIGSAIASSANRLKDKTSKSRIVVLLTDGDNNSGRISPLAAAEAAKALQIKVYTIGAGTRGYAPMPMRDWMGRKVYQNVKVDVDEDTLTKIANATGANFFRATDTETLNDIFAKIDKLEKSKIEARQYQEYRDLFPWFIGTGLAFLILHLLVSQTLTRRLP